MTTRRFESAALPAFTLVSLLLVGCGARVALEDTPDTTSTAVATNTSTGNSTSVTGPKTSYQTGTAVSSSSTVAGTGSTTTGPYTGVRTIYPTDTYTVSSTATSYVTSTGYTTGVYTSTGVYTGTGIYTGYVTGTSIYTGYVTGTSIYTGVYTGSVVQSYTYTSTGISVSSACGGIPLVGEPGQLSVTSGYVTTGSLKGYAFTWASSGVPTTCIAPSCGTTGCTPAFPSSSLCAAGVVGADTTYNSVVGVGFNLNQVIAGDSGQSVAAPKYVTVGVSSILGASFVRVQLTGADGLYYCVDAGQWSSGVPIPVTDFNSSCWDGTGKPLLPGMPVTAFNLVMPSDAVRARLFSMCLTSIVFN